MVRTQIYLTEREQSELRQLSTRMGRSQSELIRQAVDRFLESHSKQDKSLVFQEAAGLWRDGAGRPDFAALRNEADRMGVDSL
jgi:Arc/MetJ-type ribon-helix-helix transcriptional regulator